MNSENIRICTKCNESKSVSSFYGSRYWCKLCRSKYCRIRYARMVGKDIKDIRKSKVIDDKKYCNICKQYVSVSNFYKNLNLSYGLESYCKYCSRLQQHVYRRMKKLEFLIAYGGKCVCCGETNIDLLTIEHVRGKGHKLIYGFPDRIIPKLKELGWPEGHTILCMNCNFATKDSKPCPHDKEKYEKYINNLERAIGDANKDRYFALKEKLRAMCG